MIRSLRSLMRPPRSARQSLRDTRPSMIRSLRSLMRLSVQQGCFHPAAPALRPQHTALTGADPAAVSAVT
ncbi:hypothetical protein GCM10023235_25750 [Kitasatospora terrestris]|uniref:Uncharacterized protein n=1 Tax=Kitasatospora terrestris TaxID=258051 RepID=A0ABP9DQN8_9ACTN